MQNRVNRLSVWAAIVALLLLIPVVAMQFTSEVVWAAGDFVFAAMILLGAALAYELLSSKLRTTTYRTAAGVAVAATLILTWVNAAVGIIGDGPVNLLYIVIPAIAIIGAGIARLEPGGMSVTLFAMAAVQMLIPAIALLVWNPPFSPGVLPVFGLNGFFALVFAGSGLLFRHAGKMHSLPG